MATKKRASRRKKRTGVPSLLVGLGVATLALLGTLQWVVHRTPAPVKGDGPPPAEELTARVAPETEATRPEQTGGTEASELPVTRDPAPQASPEPPSPKRAAPPPQVTRREPPKPARKTPREVKPTRKGRAPIPIAIVLDDCGRDRGLMRKASAFPWKMTFAVLPYLSESGASAEIGHRAGQEIILHQPMEPFGTAADPGEGAILTGMGGQEVARLLRDNLRSIPHVQGLNNHMGSKATADGPLMGHVLAGLLALEREHPRLYFLDSKTWAGTVAYDTVRGHGLPTAMRTKFLDNDDLPVEQQFQTFLAAAEEAGAGIGIGHLKTLTLRVLEQQVRSLPPGKFELVFASELAR